VREIGQRRASFRKVTAAMKKIAAVLVGIPLVAVVFLISVPASSATEDDAAALYASKCKMCHGATAEKKMDKTKADDALIQIVLDGKTAEKPPNMPAYKEKGVSADQAKAVVEYMKALK
jgi:mono/diheme cytochrome c family protein